MGVESAIWHRGQLHEEYCFVKMVDNSSYVDMDQFDEQLFDRLHFNQHFDVNLEVAKEAREDVEEISEDRRWPRQVWTTALPEKF